MGVKNLDGYKLGIVLDASGTTKGIAALKDADKQAGKTYSTLTSLSKGFKFGLADRFKSELQEVEKLSGSSRLNAVGQHLGGMIGGGLKDGIGSVFTAANLGKLIGTAFGPGIGTAVGSMIGGAVDTALEKVSGPVMALIQKGLDLNEVLEQATVHFTAALGSKEAALAHLDRLNEMEGKSGIDLRQFIAASQRLEEFNSDLSLTEVELRAAADQAVYFGSGVSGFHAIADSLGLIAEKGELTSRTLTKLQKQGIHVEKYLSEALGLSESKVKDLIAKGRLRGDVAARIIAEGIEVHNGGAAERIVRGTLTGQRAQYENNVEELSARGTQNIAGGMTDAYRLANSLLESPQAATFVKFINDAAGGVIATTASAVETGYHVTSGLIQGMLDPKGLTTGISNYVATFTKTLRGPMGFDSHSPAQTMVPVGEDVAEGVLVGFEGYMAGAGGRRLSASVSGFTKRAQAEALSNDPRVRAMLDSIGFSEGTDKRYGYGTHVGGGRSQSNDGQKDRRVIYLGHDKAGKPLFSSADGRYQFINKTWDADAAALGLSDFSAHSQDLAAIYELMKNGAISPLMSGNFGGAVNAAKSVWASFPGAGYHQGERSLSSLKSVYDRSLAVGGIPVSNANPIPVVFQRDLQSSTGEFITSPVRAQAAYNQTLQDTGTVVVDVTDRQDALVEATQALAGPEALHLYRMQQVPGVLDATTKAIYAYSKSQEEYRKAAITGASTITSIAGALGQISGLMPSGGGQVGKKRGFFSKMLGFAAPFLSFIPGVGPILSHVAGIASNALAGNWAGVVSGIAGGLQPGGVFRGSASAPSTQLGDVTVSAGQPGLGGVDQLNLPKRALGGSVRRGRAYVVGEHRPEVFVANEDGWIHPSLQSYAHGNGSGGGSGGGMSHSLLERLASALESFESIPHDEVVQKGLGRRPDLATNAFMTHGSRDPRVIEWMQRRTAGI